MSIVIVANRVVKTLLISLALISLMACGAKNRKGVAGAEGDFGVGDTVTFYGSDLSPEQERQLLNKNTYYFAYDSNALSEEDTLSVYAHAKKILTIPKARVRVDGHTDERGSREYNVALGDRRARAIADLLMMKGVSQDKISIVSYGKEKPALAGNDESAWSQNRRGMIVYEAE